MSIQLLYQPEDEIIANLTGLIPIGFFYILVLATGVYASRKERALGGQSSEGLLLAGRKLGPLIGIFTMTATWVGGGYINGTAEAVYDSVRGMVWAQAPWGYALSLVLGGLFFAKRMRSYGFTTLLDLFERRYGERVAAGLFIPALIGELFWSAAILSALGATFSAILGFDLVTSIIVSSIIAIAYTMLGGLWSVAYTDIIQLTCILLGLGIAVPYALDHLGGMAAVQAAYEAKFASGLSLFPPLAAWSGGAGWGNSAWTWLDFALLLILGGLPWQVYFQRVLACKDDRSAVRLSIYAGVGCIVMAIPAVLIGMAGSAITDWSAFGGTAPQASMILPAVLIQATPPLVAAIGLGAVAAAVMSSVDSSILSGSSMFAWNVYRPLLHPGASEERIRLVIRISILFVGTMATLFALTVQSVYGLWYLCADLVYVILFPQLVMALYNKRSNWIGALSGAGVGLFLRIGGGEPMFNIPVFLPYPMMEAATADAAAYTNFPFRTFAMLIGLLTIWLVSTLTQNVAPAKELSAIEK